MLKPCGSSVALVALLLKKFLPLPMLWTRHKKASTLEKESAILQDDQ